MNRVVPGIYEQNDEQKTKVVVLGTLVWKDKEPKSGKVTDRLFICFIPVTMTDPIKNRAEQCILPVEEWLATDPVPGDPGKTVPRYRLMIELGP